MLALAAAGSGCGPMTALQPAMDDTRELIAVPNEDGSMYVLVEDRGGASEQTLARVWNRTATRACRGEFMVMSEGAALRSPGSLQVVRVHEGWVRCIDPEANEQMAEDLKDGQADTLAGDEDPAVGAAPTEAAAAPDKPGRKRRRLGFIGAP